MADDMNKSKAPPANGGFGVSEIEKIGQSTYNIPKSEQEQRMRASTAREQLNLLQDIPPEVIASSGALSRVQTNAPNTLRSAEGRIRSSVESRLERSNTMAMNAVSREYADTSINGQVRRMGDDRENQNRALTMMGSSYESLSERRGGLQNTIQSLGAESTSLAGNIFTNRGPRKDIQNQIATNANMASGATQELSSIDLAMRSMRASGKDPLSKYENLNTSAKSASDMLGAAAIGDEVRNGGVNISRGGRQETVKNADINSAVLSEATILGQKLKELSESAGKSTEELDKLRKEAEESANNFEKLKSASGAGGGGPSGSQYAAAAGGMFNAAGGAIQQIAVGQRLGQVANISGYAGIENQKYDTYKAARGGDVMSQMLAGQYGQAEGFGRELKTGQQAAVGAYTAGSIAQGVAGGFQVAEAGVDKVAGVGGHLLGTGGISTQEGLAGAQNIVQGVAGTAVNGMDLYRGVTTNAAAIQGTQAQMDARRAVLKVQAEQLQGFRDFGIGMGNAAQGMGGRGEAFLQNSMSDKGMQNMVDARMSPEQMAQMSGQGVSSMGSQFQQSQIFAARGLERSGNGSMGENMQRMASLAGAGANNPQAGLGSVMEAAFTKGIDSSKAMTMMVENTAAMVAASGGSTAAGINTVGANATLLGSSIDANQKNQEFAVSRAATAQEVAKNTTTDTSVSFAGMVNTARISKSTGLGGTDSIFAAQLSPADIRGLQGMTPAAAREALLKKGVDAGSATGGVSGFLGTMLKDQTNQMFTGNGAMALAGNDMRESLTSKALSGKKYTDLTDAEKKAVSQIGMSSAGKLTGEEYFNTAAGIKNATNSAAATESVAAGMKGEGGSATLKTLDDLRTSGFKQLSEAALQATKTLGGATNALKTLAELSGQFEKMGAGGAEGKFKDAAAVSAETFGKSTMQFEKSVIRFDEIMDRVGLGKDKTADAARRATGKIETTASKSQIKGRAGDR